MNNRQRTDLVNWTLRQTYAAKCALCRINYKIVQIKQSWLQIKTLLEEEINYIKSRFEANCVFF